MWRQASARIKSRSLTRVGVKGSSGSSGDDVFFGHVDRSQADVADAIMGFALDFYKMIASGTTAGIGPCLTVSTTP